MKIYLIRARDSDLNKIFSSYTENGFYDSYYFRGTGEYENTIFYVTHGMPDGYLVLNGNSDSATYNKIEFAFYMNGLLEFNPNVEEINQIITIECFGGYHNPSILNVAGKEIKMRPLGTEKAQLWGGWKKINSSFYFFAVVASKNELSLMSDDFSGFVSISPTNTHSIRKIDEISEEAQRLYIEKLYKIVIKKVKDIGDYFEAGFDYEKNCFF